jgi:hypothetical protein
LAGQQALAEGKVLLAATEFDVAQRLLKSQPQALAPAEQRELGQLQSQTTLVADLLLESLDELLLRAAKSHEDEWQAQFEQRYKRAGQSNAVVFDAEVRRDGAGQYQLDWVVRAGEEPARVEIGDLKMLHGLPLREPTRLLFGARLGRIAREQGGVWVVRFEPDSGVLLTDSRIAAACCPAPIDEPLQKLLQRQRQWLER